MNANIVYLAEKHNWIDLHPKDLKERAIDNQFLHFHHENTRKFSLTLFAPVFLPDYVIPEKQLENNVKTLAATATIIDDQLTKNGGFIAGSSITIADFAIYGELGQCNEKNLNINDFSPYKGILGWFNRMEKLKGYEKNHEFFSKIRHLFSNSNFPSIFSNYFHHNDLSLESNLLNSRKSFSVFKVTATVAQ